MPVNRYYMPRDEIAAMDGVDEIHPLNPNAKRNVKSLGDLTGLTGIGVHIFEVEPGHDTTEFHMHHSEDECVYVLEGRGLARIGDEEFEIGPGDFLGYRKGGLPHVIRVIGEQTFRSLVIGERLSADVCDYPDVGKRRVRVGSIRELMSLKHT